MLMKDHMKSFEKKSLQTPETRGMLWDIGIIKAWDCLKRMGGNIAKLGGNQGQGKLGNRPGFKQTK